MTADFTNNKYVTADFNALSDQRKIEVVTELLAKIVYYNDCVTQEVESVLNAVADLRNRIGS